MRNFLILLLSFVAGSASAQLFEEPQLGATAIDSTQVGRLTGAVDLTAFVRDNEYDGHTTRGYSLPGANLRLKAVYTAHERVRLELGAHALVFDGANKYPCYVYHDIGTWKGNQYQSGAHVLPWVRAEMQLGATRFVLGDIYGDVHHGFATPLYNKEQLFSSDPEAGLQILHYGRRLKADLFLNWQSYQFEEDTHQEAFTVGLSSEVKAGGALRLAFPIQMLVQHRGGEQDITDLGVQTIANGLVGVKGQAELPWKAVSALHFEADVLGCYQQSGHLWPFDSGLAYHLSAGAEMASGLNLRAGYFLAPKDFVTLYGSPFFSTVSLKHPDQRYDHRSTAYLQLGYRKQIARRYTFGADLEFFHSDTNLRTEDVFSASVYMRFAPEFALSKKKH